MTRCVVVSAYHGNRDMTQDFVENILKNISDQDMLVLVSAGNQMDIGEIVTPNDTRFRYVTLSENKSFSDSMNRGIERALELLPEYVCVIGNDGFPREGWLDLLIETQETTKAMIVCPEHDRPPRSTYGSRLILEDGHLAYYSMFPAVCWLLPVSTLQRIGLFDERFVGGCYEDDDYCRRVLEVGGKIVVDTRVPLRHLLSQTFGRLPNPAGIMRANEQRFREKWQNDIL